MIFAEDLGKRFGPVRALGNITLEVPTGKTVALLGPNGSGKSTLLRLVAGLLVPTSGTVAIGGRHPRQAKAQIGYLGHEPFVYRYLSATENLSFYADLYGVDRTRVGEAVAQFNLGAKKDALVRTFSRGETQRLGLARALLHDPDYLLLDEPFTGLDEWSCERLAGLIGRPGRTVLMSTHDVSRAEQVADRLVHLSAGRLI